MQYVSYYVLNDWVYGATRVKLTGFPCDRKSKLILFSILRIGVDACRSDAYSLSSIALSLAADLLRVGTPPEGYFPQTPQRDSRRSAMALS